MRVLPTISLTLGTSERILRQGATIQKIDEFTQTFLRFRRSLDSKVYQHTAIVSSMVLDGVERLRELLFHISLMPPAYK